MKSVCFISLQHTWRKRKEEKTLGDEIPAEVDSSSCPLRLYMYINMKLKEETKWRSCESCRHSVRWSCPRGGRATFPHVVDQSSQTCSDSPSVTWEKPTSLTMKHTVRPAALINCSRGQIGRRRHSGESGKTAEWSYPLYDLWIVNINHNSDSWGDSSSSGMKDPSLCCLHYWHMIKWSGVIVGIAAETTVIGFNVICSYSISSVYLAKGQRY